MSDPGIPTGVEEITSDYRRGAIVLDRVDEAPEPVYCVHAQVQCQVCGQWCHLGDKSLEAAQAGVIPICVPCVRQNCEFEAGMYVYSVPNHRREEGHGDAA